MINRIGINIVRFVLLVLIQVLVLNQVLLFGHLNPFLYILFILLLPFETPRWALLILGFALGLAVDIFSNTLGLHTISTTAMAFFRPFVLQILAPRDGYETGTSPGIHDFGYWWFARYTILLVLVHHLILYSLEILNFNYFVQSFFLYLGATLFTSLIVLITLLFFKKK